jgi:hypothetical protein
MITVRKMTAMHTLHKHILENNAVVIVHIPGVFLENTRKMLTNLKAPRYIGIMKDIVIWRPF